MDREREKKEGAELEGLLDLGCPRTQDTSAIEFPSDTASVG